jgi:hypothetical protein
MLSLIAMYRFKMAYKNYDMQLVISTPKHIKIRLTYKSRLKYKLEMFKASSHYISIAKSNTKRLKTQDITKIIQGIQMLTPKRPPF